jgi:hypothetical protein
MNRRWGIFLITSSNFFLSQFYRATNAVIADRLILDLSSGYQGIGNPQRRVLLRFCHHPNSHQSFPGPDWPPPHDDRVVPSGHRGSLIFAGADSFQMGLLGRILLGIGMACNLMGTLKLLTAWFTPTTFATLTGVVFSIGTVGNMAATVPLAFLVDAMGWRQAFMFIAGINLCLVLTLYLVVRDTLKMGMSIGGSWDKPGGESLFGAHGLFRNRTYWIISMIALPATVSMRPFKPSGPAPI